MHKWKFTVHDDGSFSAEVVRPEEPVQDCFEKEAFRALKNEVDRLKGFLQDAVILLGDHAHEKPELDKHDFIIKAMKAIR